MTKLEIDCPEGYRIGRVRDLAMNNFFLWYGFPYKVVAIVAGEFHVARVCSNSFTANRAEMHYLGCNSQQIIYISDRSGEWVKKHQYTTAYCKATGKPYKRVLLLSPSINTAVE